MNGFVIGGTGAERDGWMSRTSTSTAAIARILRVDVGGTDTAVYLSRPVRRVRPLS